MLNLLGVIFVVSSSNWYMVWMGFELSMMGFIPMFAGSATSVESMVLYFLVQTSGSSLYLISNLFDSQVLLILSMLLKLGLFPFLQWMPVVMCKLDWVACIFLTTVQKSNAFLVMLLSGSNYFFFCCGVASVVVGALGGCNQNYMRSLMAYSSISHTGYLAVMVSMSWFSLFFCYYGLYALLVIMLFGLFSKYSVNKVNAWNVKGSGVMNTLLLTIGGLPPFPLFFLKVALMGYMVSMAMVVYLVPMVLGSFISVYVYMGIIIPSSLLQ